MDFTAAARLIACLTISLSYLTALAVDIKVLGPRESARTTAKDRVHIVGRAEATGITTVTVSGVDVPVLRTGLFVCDNVPLALGVNQISLLPWRSDGTTATATSLEVTRTEAAQLAAGAAAPPAPPEPLLINPKTIEPSQNLALAPGDLLEVSFEGASQSKASFQLAGGSWVPMEEILDPVTTAPTGKYRATISVADYFTADDAELTSEPVTVRLEGRAAKATPRRSSPSDGFTSAVLAQSNGRVLIWQPGPVRLLRVSDPTALILHGLHDVRLGGPYLAVVPRDTILRAVGRRGPHYKIRLTPGLDAWVHASEVEPAPAGTPVPHLEFTSLNVQNAGDRDIISIPYNSRIPYAVNSCIGSNGNAELNIDLYGSHLATTWFIHRNPEGLVHQITGEQPATDHVRLKVALNSTALWGYQTEATTSALRISVRHEPKLEYSEVTPLKGLTIAVNAGHGGREGGAGGLSGAREADVTLAVAKAVQEELTAAGATVIMTRNTDEVVRIGRRAEIAMEANAHLFVSIHCNSSGTENGYLSTSGTATFYKYPFNHSLSETMLDSILRHTGLPNFGNVGNFNYGPIRLLTWMPAVLVEQAFISNPKEEAMLTDPAFQKTMAKAIRAGIAKFVSPWYSSRAVTIDEPKNGSWPMAS